MKTLVSIVAVALLACGSAFGEAKTYPKPQVASAVGQIAPDFTLKDQDGRSFNLSDQRGHWVLLFFYRGHW